MRIQWMRRRTAVALAAGTVALAAIGSSGSGLLAGLFDKDRCELPKRVPCGDCSFGYSRTAWRPWGTCCETPSPQAFSNPVSVPNGAYYSSDGIYSPAIEAPKSPYHAVPHDGTPIIIESPGAAIGNGYSPAGPRDQTPILSKPTPVRRTDPATNESQFQAPLPVEQPPFAPDVRSIESPVPSGETSLATPPRPPHDPRNIQQPLISSPESARQYRGPIEDPIRGLLPGSGYSPTPGSGTPAPVTNAPRSSTPAFDEQRRPAVNAPQDDPSPFASSRRAAPQADYSEYIPLPTAEPVPRSIPLPNPADRAHNRAEPSVPQDTNPLQQSPVQQSAPGGDQFDPGTLPLPQSGTRPGAPSADSAASQTGILRPHDPYADYRPLPTATESKPGFQPARPGFEQLPSAGPVFEEDRVTRTSAERVSRHVQKLTPRQSAEPGEARSASRPLSTPSVAVPARSAHQPVAAEPEYVVPDWKPLSDPAKTYRSTVPEPARDWRTLQTPTGNRAAPANSEQQSRTTRITAPPWQSRNGSSGGGSAGTTQSRHATQYTPSAPPRSSASSVDSRSLPSVEALLNGEPAFDSRPARVVQETLYDVVEIDRRSAGYSLAVAGRRTQDQTARGSAPAPDDEWNPIWTDGGIQQSAARSERLAR
jgi:hypothetical protein